jgi:anti-sigma factor (TIGR02949 family)
MTCRELIDVLADYLDGVLPSDLAAELERHLAECAPCRAYLATYRATRALGAEAARVEMPEEMRERLRRLLAAPRRDG